jgi:hypothetical protein
VDFHRLSNRKSIKIMNMLIFCPFFFTWVAAKYVFSRSRPINERERSTLYNERPTSATSLTARPAQRNKPASTIDDKQLRDKLRKFLPGKK